MGRITDHPGVGAGAVAPISEVTNILGVEVTGGRVVARAGADSGLGTCHT